MKNILIVHYSQFGQSQQMVDTFKKGLTAGTKVDEITISLEVDYPKPWKISNFFSIMPDCILGKTPKIKAIQHLSNEYDLVVLGYQIWFLSPSLPMQAALEQQQLRDILKGSEVLSLVSCRDMWISGVRKMNTILKTLDVKTVKTVVLTDTSPAWANFITTPRWMLTGKRDSFLIFPRAGIKDIEFSKLSALAAEMQDQSVEFSHFKPEKYSHGQRAKSIFMEQIGIRVFRFYARLIDAQSQSWRKKYFIGLFRINLVGLILVLLPFFELIELFCEKAMNAKGIKLVEAELNSTNKG